MTAEVKRWEARQFLLGLMLVMLLAGCADSRCRSYERRVQRYERCLATPNCRVDSYQLEMLEQTRWLVQQCRAERTEENR